MNKYIGVLIGAFGIASGGCESKQTATVSTPVAAQTTDDELKLPYELFLARAQNELKFKTELHVRMFKLNEAAWAADLDKGTITFTCPDVIITSPVQVVGTYNTADSTWLWGWANPSVSKPLAKSAESVRKYGQSKGIANLTTQKLSCTEQDAWDFSALACKLSSGQGVYRGPAGDTLVFFVYEQVNVKKRP